MANNINWGKIYESTAWGSGVSDNSISWGKSYADLAGGGGTDADAQAFITAASITDSTQQSAIETLVTDLKTAGVWTKMKAIYPIVGGTASSHKFNLKDPRDLDAAFRLTFSSGWTHSSTGATPNGTSAYADTNFNPISIGSSTSDFHLSYYGSTSSGGSKTYIGSSSGSGGTFNSTALGLYNGGSDEVGQIAANQSAEYAGDLTAYSGMKSVSVNGSRVNNYYANGTASGTTSTSTGFFDNFNIYLAASEIGGSIALFNNATHKFNTIGDGLTSSEMSDLYTAVQAFQTTLGRQV